MSPHVESYKLVEKNEKTSLIAEDTLSVFIQLTSVKLFVI